MAEQRNRYPGAQPFSDDDFSRKVFFGRENAARVLADKILANHMVTVYARSGLGKTSLLQAGVAPKLREEGFLPLFVRVNDTNIGPFRALLESIPGEAERQHVEYVPGRAESLWSFFKTAEFWRDDLLQTPVLILDQFEELFTLQSEHARAHFLDELSYLTRGVRPPSEDDTMPGELSEHPPVVNIVLSLREDYLGLLEEAAEHIPQILDARFRLAPLDVNGAKEAIVGPATVTDPGLETEPFTLDPTAVSEILNYLSQARTHMVAETRRYVEPFQLQLICRRMEQIADARQKASETDLTITMADLGGESGLTKTLRDFYANAIRSVPDGRGRRRASRRLCEKYLISTEGRRLSLEENEIRRQLHVPKETLQRLVTSRLLRSDIRSESTYYELSHDALVEPVLASRRIRARVMFALGMTVGVTLFSLALLSILGMTLSLFTEDWASAKPEERWGMGTGAVIAILVALGILATSTILLRRSARSMLRYRRARELAIDGPEMRLRSRLAAGLPALVGGAVVAIIALLLLFFMAVIAFGPVARSAARELDLLDYVDHRIDNGIGVDTLVYLVAAAAMLTAGARLCRWGVYRLAGISGRRALPAAPRPGRGTGLYAASRTLLGGISLLSALMLAGFAVLKVQCGNGAPRSMPGWLDEWFNMLAVDCRAGYPDGMASDLLTDLLALTALLVVAIPTLRRGIVATRQVLPRPSGGPAIARANSAEAVFVTAAKPANTVGEARQHRWKGHRRRVPHR